MDPDEASKWHHRWTSGNTRWDAGAPHPALVHLLSTHSLPPGRYLVPGCGTGYDVLAIADASPHHHALGIDVSPTATSAALHHMHSSAHPRLAASGRAQFRTADFFAMGAGEGGERDGEGFDGVYDHRFLCALPPGMREEWARVVRRLVEKRGGELVTLIFPVGEWEGGPPYAVGPELYRKLLEPVGFRATELRVLNEKEWLGRWRLDGPDGGVKN